MIELAMSMPAFGPGAVTGGSCDFRSSLSVNVLNRMGSEKAIKTEALNLATADSELSRVDPIGIYKLFVEEATFTDKASGRIVTETTLVSPDFDGEAIGVWTDAGENGTGSKEEYSAILDRAKTFAETSGTAAMFWISPSKRERSDGLPQHRAYLWKKNDKGEVTAYSYQLSGSNNTLTKTLQSLAPDAIFVDSQTLLWEKNQDSVSHKRVFNAYRSSLSEKEASKIEGFLDRFKNESELPDSERWSSIEKNKKQYEAKLREVYKGDIQKAIEVISSGFLGLARSVESEAPNEVVLSGGFCEEFGRKDGDDNKGIKDLSSEEKEIVIKTIQGDIIEPIVTAFIGVLQEDGFGGSQTQIVEFSHADEADEDQDDDWIVTVMIPVVPVFEGILLQLTEHDFYKDEEITIQKEETEEFITGLIMLMLSPTEETVSMTENPKLNEPSDTSSTDNNDLLFQPFSPGRSRLPIRQLAEPYGLIPRTHPEGFPEGKPEIQIVSPAIRKEGRIADFQEILLLIYQRWQTVDLDEQDYKHEEVIATTADDLLEFFLTEMTDRQIFEKPFIGLEQLTNIKLLLEVYNDEETAEDIKEFVILFLFHELHNILSSSPSRSPYEHLEGVTELLLPGEVSLIFAKLELIFQDPIFTKRYENFILCVEKLFSSELLNDDGSRDFSLIELIEMMKVKQHRKKSRNYPRNGIIYQYLYQVVPIEL